MPTFATTETFKRDMARLSRAEREALKNAVAKFVEDLKSGHGFREGLRVKGIRAAKGVFEMTWADDGRCTFQYGPPLRNEEPHVIWRRVGGHDIFSSP